MRCCLLVSALAVAVVSVGAGQAVPQPASETDHPPLERRVADLERQLAALQQELQALRRELQRPAQSDVAPLTPEEAVRAFQQNPDKRFTVEFGVESAGWPDGPIPIGEDQTPPIMADWDGRLSNGGKFTLLLTARAIRGLEDVGVDFPDDQPAGVADIGRVNALCQHLKSRGVRVTGFIKPSRPQEAHADYYIVVDDPTAFRINRQP